MHFRRSSSSITIIILFFLFLIRSFVRSPFSPSFSVSVVSSLMLATRIDLVFLVMLLWCYYVILPWKSKPLYTEGNRMRKREREREIPSNNKQCSRNRLEENEKINQLVCFLLLLLRKNLSNDLNAIHLEWKSDVETGTSVAMKNQYVLGSICLTFDEYQ